MLLPVQQLHKYISNHPLFGVTHWPKLLISIAIYRADTLILILTKPVSTFKFSLFFIKHIYLSFQLTAFSSKDVKASFFPRITVDRHLTFTSDCWTGLATVRELLVQAVTCSNLIRSDICMKFLIYESILRSNLLNADPFSSPKYRLRYFKWFKKVYIKKYEDAVEPPLLNEKETCQFIWIHQKFYCFPIFGWIGSDLVECKVKNLSWLSSLTNILQYCVHNLKKNFNLK